MPSADEQAVALVDQMREGLGAALPAAERRDALERVDRWGPDLVAAVCAAYGPGLLPRLEGILARGIMERPAELRRRDRRRLLRPDRLQQPDMIGYAAYADRFGGSISGVADRIDHLTSLGVTSLHLLPLLKPRPGANDGGYAVADYREVNPELGTMSDLEDLARHLHAADIDLMIDLVLNHVAREHPWARAAREGDPHYRAYFRIYPDRTVPDAFEETLWEVFPDFAPGNFTWDDELDGWVWTSFNSWQWDLDWDNPDVFCEFAELILWLANRGVDCLRLDAIAFIAKDLGTSCQNLPRVHDITQALRAILRIAAPGVSLMAEAIVGPEDLVAYLGRGRHAGRVSDLAYHNSLMVQIWSALATGDGRLMATSLGRFPRIPVTASWATYVRCHDDIGWAISDEDAAAVGWSGSAHRAFLADFFAGRFPGSTARGRDFQDNPLTGDRRTSGSAAALVGLDAAVDARDAEAIELAIRRLHLAYAMAFGYGGVPLIWMGDEIALPNDDEYGMDPDHADDNRWMHRPRMDWGRAEEAEDPSTVPGRALAGLRTLAAARRGLPSLHAAAPTLVEVPGDPAVVLFTRQPADGTVVQVYNVSGRPARLDRSVLTERGLSQPRDRLGLYDLVDEGGHIVLAPYAAHWIVDS